MSEIKNILYDQFEKEVILASHPVLVDFWAPTCKPCQMLTPILQELANDYENRLRVVKVNVDMSPDLASRFDIMGIPVVLLFRGGNIVDRLFGVLSKQELVDKIEKYL